MTYKQLAKTIRTQQQEYESAVSRMNIELSVSKSQCKHNQVVVVCSENTGSYSWDYDDAYPEARQCLICGFMETAEKKQFKTLLNPFTRLELGYPYSRHSKYRSSPLAKCLFTPLNDLLKWVEKNGYPLWK